MANSYQSYGLADPSISLMENLLESQQKVKKTQEATTGHKGALSKEFEADIQSAQKRAQDELNAMQARQQAEIAAAKKKSKKGGFFKKLVPQVLSFFSPFVGGLVGGLIGGKDQERALKLQKRIASEGLSSAQKAKMFATDIDPRWQKLFTSKAAGKYKGEAESAYGDIVQQATGDYLKAEEAWSGRSKNILADAIKGGLTSYVTGKGMQKGFDKLRGGAMKEAKNLKDLGVSGKDIEAVSKAGGDALSISEGFSVDPTYGPAINPGEMKLLKGMSPENINAIQSLSTQGFDLKTIQELMGKLGQKSTLASPFASMPMLDEIIKSLGKGTGAISLQPGQGDFLSLLMSMGGGEGIMDKLTGGDK